MKWFIDINYNVNKELIGELDKINAYLTKFISLRKENKFNNYKGLRESDKFKLYVEAYENIKTLAELTESKLSYLGFNIHKPEILIKDKINDSYSINYRPRSFNGLTNTACIFSNFKKEFMSKIFFNLNPLFREDLKEMVSLENLLGNIEKEATSKSYSVFEEINSNILDYKMNYEDSFKKDIAREISLLHQIRLLTCKNDEEYRVIAKFIEDKYFEVINSKDFLSIISDENISFLKEECNNSVKDCIRKLEEDYLKY